MSFNLYSVPWEYCISEWSIYWLYLYLVIDIFNLTDFRRMATFGRYFAISAKGDNVCVSLIVWPHVKPVLKKGLLYKGRICSLWEQILTLWSRYFFSEGNKITLTELSLLNVYLFPLSMNIQKLYPLCQQRLHNVRISLNFLAAASQTRRIIATIFLQTKAYYCQVRLYQPLSLQTYCKSVSVISWTDYNSITS